MNTMNADPTTMMTFARDRQAMVRAGYPARARRRLEKRTRPHFPIAILGKALHRPVVPG